MGSKANTSLSAIRYIESYRQRGISLKSRALKRWLKRRGIGQAVIAKIFGMKNRVFRRRLYKRKKFPAEAIKSLILFMGARAAINVLWFPTLKEKQRVKRAITEETMERDHYENLIFADKEEDTEEDSEYIDGENWGYTDDYLKLVMYSDELPSRKMMRRRNNG